MLQRSIGMQLTREHGTLHAALACSAGEGGGGGGAGRPENCRIVRMIGECSHFLPAAEKCASWCLPPEAVDLRLIMIPSGHGDARNGRHMLNFRLSRQCSSSVARYIWMPMTLGIERLAG